MGALLENVEKVQSGGRVVETREPCYVTSPIGIAYLISYTHHRQNTSTHTKPETLYIVCTGATKEYWLVMRRYISATAKATIVRERGGIYEQKKKKNWNTYLPKRGKKRTTKHQGQATGRRHICPCSEPNPVAPTFCWVERMRAHTYIYIHRYVHVYHQVCGGLDVSLMRRMTSAQDEKEDHPNIRLYSNFFFLFFCSSLFLSCLFFQGSLVGRRKKKMGGGCLFRKRSSCDLYGGRRSAPSRFLSLERRTDRSSSRLSLSHTCRAASEASASDCCCHLDLTFDSFHRNLTRVYRIFLGKTLVSCKTLMAVSIPNDSSPIDLSAESYPTATENCPFFFSNFPVFYSG